MYEFLVIFVDMETNKIFQKKIDVDCTPLDAEMYESECTYAWKVAIERAMQIVSEDTRSLYLESIEFLAC